MTSIDIAVSINSCKLFLFMGTLRLGLDAKYFTGKRKAFS